MDVVPATVVALSAFSCAAWIGLQLRDDDVNNRNSISNLLSRSGRIPDLREVAEAAGQAGAALIWAFVCEVYFVSTDRVYSRDIFGCSVVVALIFALLNGVKKVGGEGSSRASSASGGSSGATTASSAPSDAAVHVKSPVDDLPESVSAQSTSADLANNSRGQRTDVVPKDSGPDTEEQAHRVVDIHLTAELNNDSALDSSTSRKEKNAAEKDASSNAGATATGEVPPSEGLIKNAPVLNRDQTEEWKGWMQVAFVFYHYYNAKEIYIPIRLMVAAYVWLTGFGNFSYFWIRRDYSFLRWCKMMFRMAFLVTCLVLLNQNDFMLYYICALHMYWFCAIYVCMGIREDLNYYPRWMALKFCLLIVFTLVVWDVPGVFDSVWFVFKPLFQIDGSLHEWHFRSKLDHLIPIWGMICAYNYPTYTKWLTRLESQSPSRQAAVKIPLAITCCLVLFGWTYWAMFSLPDRFIYNQWHPYTAFVPITAYIILRNLTPWLRNRYLPAFSWVGKITLETYLLQFHVFLGDNAARLTYFLPGYPLITFVIATLSLAASGYIAFKGTVGISDWLMPRDNTSVRFTGRRAATLLGVIAVAVPIGLLASNFGAGVIFIAAAIVLVVFAQVR